MNKYSKNTVKNISYIHMLNYVSNIENVYDRKIEIYIIITLSLLSISKKKNNGSFQMFRRKNEKQKTPRCFFCLEFLSSALYHFM